MFFSHLLLGWYEHDFATPVVHGCARGSEAGEPLTFPKVLGLIARSSSRRVNKTGWDLVPDSTEIQVSGCFLSVAAVRRASHRVQISTNVQREGRNPWSKHRHQETENKLHMTARGAKLCLTFPV